jgi:hypothetical protein
MALDQAAAPDEMAQRAEIPAPDVRAINDVTISPAGRMTNHTALVALSAVAASEIAAPKNGLPNAYPKLNMALSKRRRRSRSPKQR